MSLRQVLVDAYRPYLAGVLIERGWDGVAGIGQAIADGEHWLGDALDDLLDRTFADQTRGPLEVFQEAMRFPTEALATADVPRPPRDEVTANALPGDVYDLAPASTRDLGEAVWHAHLQWGAAKAAALGGHRPGSPPGGSDRRDPAENDDHAAPLDE
jgi:hypothetical protein